MLYQTKNPHGGDIYDGAVTLDYSANTNPFGTPQAILDAVTAALGDMHRYPDPYCRALVEKISRFECVPKNYILCGNGAADLIYAYCAAVKPERAAQLAPTFSEYGLGLGRVGCTDIRNYILRQENGFALEEGILSWLEENRPQVLFLCNPNNPTGKTMDPALLERILGKTKELHIRLFVDECFLDLTDGGESLKPFLKENPHVFLLKAFTKSYGMAGIRLGYCLSSDAELLTRMSRASQPWNVSSLAQAAGKAALDQKEFLEKTRVLIRDQRKYLKAELEALGFWVSDSETNFLLFRGPEDFHTELREKFGIAIRNCDNYIGLGSGWYRIAVRLPEENRRLIAAMREILGRA